MHGNRSGPAPAVRRPRIVGRGPRERTVVVLCEPTDFDALWAARGLRRRGARVELVGSQALGCALGWEHRLGREPASVSITLHDGRTIDSGQDVAVLNRLGGTPSAHLAAAEDDRDYARQELHALFLSWLSALPGPVVNRPTPQSLSGGWRHPSHWALLAARAGIAAEYRQSSADPPEFPATGRLCDPFAPRRSVLVVGERVISVGGDVPGRTAEACRRLRELSGETLLGVELAQSDGELQLDGVTTTPALSPGGDAALDALEAVLLR